MKEIQKAPLMNIHFSLSIIILLANDFKQPGKLVNERAFYCLQVRNTGKFKNSCKKSRLTMPGTY